MAHPDPVAPEARARLGALVFEFLERREEEGDAVLEALCAAHADLARELRARVALLGSSGLLDDPPAERLPERIGEFRPLRRLGEGGMGVVYLAEQVSLGRTVALKVVRPDLLLFEGARERFRREAAAVARLAHPGIVPVHTVGEEDGLPYLAMELVHGASLASVLERLSGRDPQQLAGRDLERAVLDVLAETGATPAAAGDSSDSRTDVFGTTWSQAVARIVRQVAEALDHAHQRGVLHRDVKPSNIMLTAGGRALLLDFGLALLEGTDKLTRSGAHVGSLPYLPPEVLARGAAAVSVRSDVYSLGVSLYELLTLRMPFRGESPLALTQAIAAGDPTPPRRLRPDLSWELETCCLAAIELDPERRYASASALARDLDNALALRPLEARRAGWMLRARRLAQRHPAWTVACALSGAVALFGPLAYARQEHRRRLDVEHANGETERANRDLAAALSDVQRERDLAQHERERAESNLARAFEAIDTMLTKVGDERLVGVPRAEGVRSELLAEALRFQQELLTQASDDPGRRYEHALAFGRVGSLLVEMGRANEAREHFQRELELLEGLPAALQSEAGPEIIRVLQSLGNAELSSGDEVAAERSYELAVSALRQLPEVPGKEWATFKPRSTLLSNLALIKKRRGRTGEARRLLEECLTTEVAGARVLPDDADWVYRQAITHLELGILARMDPDAARGSPDFDRALELAQDAEQRLDGSPEALRLLGKAYLERATFRAARGQWDEADADYEEALAIHTDLVSEHPDLIGGTIGLAALHMARGRWLLERNAWERGIEELRACEALVEQARQRFGDTSELLADLSELHATLADAHARSGAPAEALGDARKALSLQEDAARAAASSPVQAALLGLRRLQLAQALGARDPRDPECERLARQVGADAAVDAAALEDAAQLLLQAGSAARAAGDERAASDCTAAALNALRGALLDGRLTPDRLRGEARWRELTDDPRWRELARDDAR